MMERASTSSERTPLVQPTYVFESSLTRRYQKRLRNFQCAICVSLVAFFGIAMLVAVSYNLSDDDDDNVVNGTETPEVVNLTVVSMPSDLAPMLKLSWPLQGKPSTPWVGDPPTTEAIASAVTQGNSALADRQKLESTRKPLAIDTPAGRAQRAAATSQAVKPLAEAAFAVEQATRALTNG